MFNERKQRKDVRLKDRDYAGRGVYFVTICSFERLELFGSVHDGIVCESAVGAIVSQQWLGISESFSTVDLDLHIIMPNHIHGIIVLQPSDEVQITLGNIIRQFKAKSTTAVRRFLSDPEVRLWQRNYYEHVVRSTDDLDRMRVYIKGNPSNWQTDEYLPRRS